MRKVLMLMAALVVVAMMSFVGCENESPAPAETPAEATEQAPAPETPAPAPEAPAPAPAPETPAPAEDAPAGDAGQEG